jgi:hypothetical protein
MEESARDVGASPLRVFWSITLPQAGPTIAAALLLSFVGTFYETEGAWLIGAPEIRTMPILMILFINNSIIVQYGAVLSVFLWVPSFIALLFARRVISSGRRPRLRLEVSRSKCGPMAGTWKSSMSARSSAAGPSSRSRYHSLKVANGESICLLPVPLRVGKSTLWRMIGGFDVRGERRSCIAIDGEDVSVSPPEQRPTGMVFQSHALDAYERLKNIAFGLSRAACRRPRSPQGRGGARSGRPPPAAG